MATKRASAPSDVDVRGARKGSKHSSSKRAAKHRRLRVVYDVQGPRVRLGVGWLLLELVALLGGHWTIALLFAVTAAIAALQTAKAWRHVHRHPHRVTAGVGAAAIGMAGAVTTGLVGVAILATVAAAFVIAYGERASATRWSTPSSTRRTRFGARCFPGSRPHVSRSPRAVRVRSRRRARAHRRARTRRATTSWVPARATPSRDRSPASLPWS